MTLLEARGNGYKFVIFDADLYMILHPTIPVTEGAGVYSCVNQSGVVKEIWALAQVAPIAGERWTVIPKTNDGDRKMPTPSAQVLLEMRFKVLEERVESLARKVSRIEEGGATQIERWEGKMKRLADLLGDVVEVCDE
jgi:hypothetical protein